MLPLSSNWKKLQQNLPTSKQHESQSSSKAQEESQKSPQKRKRDVTDVSGIRGNGASVYDRQNERSLTSTKRSNSVSMRRGSNVRQSLSRPVSMHNLSVTKASNSESKEVDHDNSAKPDGIDDSDVEGEGVSVNNIPGKYIALDCEMVGVGPLPDDNSQLARVSLVNWHGKQVYDTYVLPILPVTDYRTHVSGIRPHHLRVESGARPFKEVYSDVATFLNGRILVGHYLRNDLELLGVKHPKQDIRDTSSFVKYRKMCEGGPKLKDLSKKVLGLSIQNGAHNSVEDARAAMMLYRESKDEIDVEVGQRYGKSNLQQKPKPGPAKKNKSKKKRGAV